jgi:glycosyltransferase involved in cell wall biosynthesis
MECPPGFSNAIHRKSDPRVSVIVPAYNRRAFLGECLESVYSQTFPDFECIVVDDGSTDGTRQWLERVSFPVRPVFKSRGGVASARNTGIREARGALIAFLDSDDRWLPDKLEIQAARFERNPACRACYTDEIWVRDGKRVPRSHRLEKAGGAGAFYKMLTRCLVGASSVMIHREVFEKTGLFDESLPVCEDYDLWLRIAARYPFELVSRPLVEKRAGHPGQLSTAYWGMDRFRIRSLAGLLDSGILAGERLGRTRAELAKKGAVFIQGCEKRGKYEDARRYRKLLEQYGIFSP